MRISRRFIALILATCGLLGSPQVVSQPDYLGTDSIDSFMRVTHYQLSLHVAVNDKSIAGSLTVSLAPSTQSADAVLALGKGGLTIEAVSLLEPDARPLNYSVQDGQLLINLPALDTTATPRLEIRYRGAPTFGLQFSELGEEVSTAFSTEQWMPVQTSPALRASFALDLVVPSEFSVVVTGSFVESAVIDENLSVHRWREVDAMPAYLFGFSAGRFREVVDQSKAPLLRYLAPPPFSEQDLLTIFTETRNAISYFEERSGFSYPAADYTQVLLRRGYGQELNGIAVMRESYGKAVLEDPQAIWLAIHELAHQWWGNRVTNSAWTHFWLNEGIANFLTATYFERRFGQAAYDELIANSQRSYEQLRQDGHDKALVFPDWKSPSRQDRTLVYDKGTYVLYLLRQELGEEAFWNAIQLFTARHWQQSVQSSDLQRAMEEASGRNLKDFFNEWVYAIQ